MDNFQPRAFDYDLGLYVPRTGLREEIGRWLNSPRNPPILSLVGPPGTGKSWLIRDLEDKPPEPYPAFRLRLDAQQLLNYHNHDQIKLDLIRRANTACIGLNFPEDTLPSLGAIIEDLRQRLCKLCPGNSPLILVDGCDDLGSLEAFGQLQREYLAPFVGTGPNCFRMVIARRYDLTEYALKLKSMSLAVGVFENPLSAAEEQHERLYGHRELTGILPEGHQYKWSHPLLNSLLWQYHVEGIQITADVLTHCCRSLLNRPPRILTRVETRDLAAKLEELIRLARSTENEWTGPDFEGICKRKLDLTDLKNQIILFNRDTSKYKIADGLRELLQDLANMR